MFLSSSSHMRHLRLKKEKLSTIFGELHFTGMVLLFPNVRSRRGKMLREINGV